MVFQAGAWSMHLCKICKYSIAAIGPGPWVLSMQSAQDNGDQHNSVDSVGQLWTVLIQLPWFQRLFASRKEPLEPGYHLTGCVIMAYLVEFHPITKILLTLTEITKKITKNFQLPKESEKSRNITKSN
jgi:hypothetical protein